jgi:uncharacterized protein involved in exopolysaccharide biosynthesis
MSDEQFPTAEQGYGEGDESNFLDFLITLARHKRLVLGLPVVAAVIAALISLLLPNVYTASTRIMPPQADQSAMALGALSNITGGSAIVGQALGLKNPSELYVGILRGHTIADRIIGRFDLKRRYDKDTQIETRLALEDVTKIRSGRDGLIVIEVDDEDPQVAAQIANGYAEELDRLSQHLALTDASQRRLFFDREVVAVREKLAAAEAILRSTQEKTGLIQPDGQARAIFDAFADLRARIAAKEVEIASLRMFATATNPNYIRAQQELVSLRGQLEKLERVQPDQKAHGNILVPTTKVPEAGLAYLRSLREVKYYEALFELLAKQFELAKMDEARDAALIQVVDKAVAPDRKSKPRRSLIVLLAVLCAAIGAMLTAVFMDKMAKARLNPVGLRRLSLLKEHLRL